MPIKDVMTSQRVPVKIWTDDVDDRSKEPLTIIVSWPVDLGIFEVCPTPFWQGVMAQNSDG